MIFIINIRIITFSNIINSNTKKQTIMGNNNVGVEVSDATTLLSHIESLEKQTQLVSMKYLKHPSQDTQYLKILYIDEISVNDKNQALVIQKSLPVLNSAYFKFREQYQRINVMHHVPQIIFNGKRDPDDLSQSVLKGTQIQLCLVMHFAKTLKIEIEQRFAKGQIFSEQQILKIMRESLLGLWQILKINAQANHLLLLNGTKKKKLKSFILKPENIFINCNNGSVCVSDFQHLLKRTFAEKQSKNLGKSNYAFINLKKESKTCQYHQVQKEEQSSIIDQNLQSLAEIIEVILEKNSSLSDRKLTSSSSSFQPIIRSNIGQTYRNYTHSNANISLSKKSSTSRSNILKNMFQIQNLLKLLKRPCQNIKLLISHIEDLQKLKKKSFLVNQKRHLSQSSSKKNFINILSSRRNSSSTDSKCLNLMKNMCSPLKSCKISQQNARIKTATALSSSDNNAKAAKPTTNLLSNKKSQTKIRLSLKKTHCKTALIKQKQNIPNFHQSTQSRMSSKLIIQPKKINIFAKKKTSQRIIERNCLRDNIVFTPKIQKNEEISVNDYKIHLNPIKNKNTIKQQHQVQRLNKNQTQNHKSINKHCKTSDQGIEVDCIQNFSSITSKQNTLSSIGIALAQDMLKTQVSADISDEKVADEGTAVINSHHSDIRLIIWGQQTLSSNQITASKQLGSKTQGNNKYGFSSSCQDKQIPAFLKQFELPEKNLQALNNFILRQKDVIIEESSFQQSQLNSARQTISNSPELTQKRASKMILDELIKIGIKEDPQNQNQIEIYQNQANERKNIRMFKRLKS